MHELAQVNIARLAAPLESPRLAGFVAALDEINSLGERAPGFVWRLQTEDGDATAIRAFEWDAGDSCGVIMNLTVWESIEALRDFTYSGRHLEFLRRRREWFERHDQAITALWWVPAGHRPTPGEAEERITLLRACGPTQGAFTFKQFFPPSSDDSNTSNFTIDQALDLR